MRLSPRTYWPAAVLGVAGLATAFALLPGGHPAAAAPATKLAAASLPQYAHVVVVMEENHSFSDIIGDTSDAPYMNQLANEGALLTSSYAVTHPSDPNYLALFAGNTFGLTADECPLKEGTTANLGSELLAAGDTFKGYSEGLPKAGSTTCTSGNYASKHSPWVNFSNIPSADQQPFSAFPTSANYASLPTVSWVIPNLNDDMHNGTIKQADTWLDSNLSAYATWAATHDSLLIVTWDEDDYTENNQIPTIFYGQGVTQGRYDENVDHYNVLATLEQMYGLSEVGSSKGATTITDIWN
jgi:acid phosphatase